MFPQHWHPSAAKRTGVVWLLYFKRDRELGNGDRYRAAGAEIGVDPEDHYSNSGLEYLDYPMRCRPLPERISSLE
jgi:hypothetical protein